MTIVTVPHTKGDVADTRFGELAFDGAPSRSRKRGARGRGKSPGPLDSLSGALYALMLVLSVLVLAACGARDVDRDARVADGGQAVCTLSMCRVDDSGTRACCFGEEFPPPKPYAVCCRGPIGQLETCAYDPSTKRYMTFCDLCIPSDWVDVESPHGTCP